MIIDNPVVLLVDDSENDAMLMRMVFKRSGFTRPLHIAVNGDDAVAYLQGDGAYADRVRYPLPAVVLLDLNMPGRNGFEVLQWMISRQTFKRQHVHILSASTRAEDIERAYDLGVNSYLVKPGTFDGLVAMARGLLEWMKLTHFASSVAEGTRMSPPSAAGQPAFDN